MRIVVTGSLGQLGGQLCRLLGPEATGLDLPEFDLTDHRGVLRRIEELAPDVVINCAAYTHVDRAEAEPQRCRAVNVSGVAYLAEACRRTGASLVQISTDYVFGADPARQTPYREDDPPGPVNVYGLSKLESEHHAKAAPRWLIVRTCGLYGRLGPRTAGNFVETMIQQAKQRGRLRVVADQHCTPSYVGHVAQAIRFLVAVRATGIYHVVNQGQTTWYEFAREIFRILGWPVQVEPISSGQWHSPARRPSYSVLDASKYLALPGRPDLPPWQEALREYLALRETA
jgi:dTDP-4-dehydrorhamnose reductase